uniref:SET domain containing 4 n=1 Tax=Rousettus aegyptiacus TaxID=9407 RepID=A0A7J8HUZ2_ROUAE|nr:SET domain containing 4 [Rousettus aegyptiacus]
MKKGRGRTSRIRRRKLSKSFQFRGVNESYKPEFIELRKWLKDRKFEDTNLIPASFPGTGRGLMSRTSLREGQVIISLPESCLLTTDTVIRSYLGAYVAKWRPPLSPLLALCTFLVAEKHAGDRSPWKPYLEILPKTYTCPVCLEPEVVKAAFNEETRCYEIRTSSSCRRHEEVFICYGPHDNQRLLLEYGFVAARNPHACVYVSQDKQMNKKISILKDHDFIENLTFGWDGPSWRLLTALKLLCLEAEEFTCWKKVLLGEIISDTNEKTSLDIAQKICQYFIEETNAVLQKVSYMKDTEGALVSQLSLVETLWTEELKILQASAETLNSLQTACT